jgi:hypothetical protein
MAKPEFQQGADWHLNFLTKILYLIIVLAQSLIEFHVLDLHDDPGPFT